MKNQIFNESAICGLKKLPEKSIQCCVTSPPYYQKRDYKHKDQIGMEKTPELYIKNLVNVFREVKRVLADDGTLWVNIGDSYCARPQANGNTHGKKDFKDKSEALRCKINHPSIKPKDLIGIPWMLAFALRADGWYLRQDIIWQKPNAMPESVKDRCTASHEYIFLFSKKPKYYFDSDAILEPLSESTFNDKRLFNSQYTEERRQRDYVGNAQQGSGMIKPRTGIKFGGNKYGDSDEHQTKSGNTYTPTGMKNKRSVWTVATKPYRGSHFAVYPQELIVPCIRAGSKPGDIILDPFFGSGTTGEVALRLGRSYTGFEINPTYIRLAMKRLSPFLNEFFT